MFNFRLQVLMVAVSNPLRMWDDQQDAANERRAATVACVTAHTSFTHSRISATICSCRPGGVELVIVQAVGGVPALDLPATHLSDLRLRQER